MKQKIRTDAESNPSPHKTHKMLEIINDLLQSILA